MILWVKMISVMEGGFISHGRGIKDDINLPLLKTRKKGSQLASRRIDVIN